MKTEPFKTFNRCAPFKPFNVRRLNLRDRQSEAFERNEVIERSEAVARSAARLNETK